MVELIPVIEFEPLAYSQEGRRSPPVERHQDWYKYWKESLADSGITELEPVENSWLVRVVDLTQPNTIARLLRVHLGDQVVETLDDLDSIGPLNGGYVLKTETYSLLPTCCVSLEDIKSWEEALRIKQSQQQPAWTPVWIGHPWIYCRRKGSHLEFSGYAESPVGLEMAFSVRPDELQSAIESAREIVTEFGHRARSELAKLVPQTLIDSTLAILLWGHSS